MKVKPTKQFVTIEAWTTKFLGTREKGRSLLRLIESIDGGKWVPERWNTIEPIRKPFTKDSEDEIMSHWIADSPHGSGKIWNDLLFRRSSPRALIEANARRFGAPKLNSIWLELDAKPFMASNGSSRLKTILQTFVSWSEGVYGNVYYSGQAHKRIVQMTPLQRLSQAYWLNFFGDPYLEMFGMEKVINAPCHSIERFENHGILLQAAARFDSPEITDSDSLLIALEEYLGPDAFAGRGYPQIPCRVPCFDLSETFPPSPSVYRH